MATIKISKEHLEHIEKYIDKIERKFNKKLSKKHVIEHVINNYHQIIEETMIEKLDDDMTIVSVDNQYIEVLKEDKKRLHQPMYLILNACLNQYFSYGKGIKKNIALCRFKRHKKIYAFYFDDELLSIKKGNIVKVKSSDLYNPKKEVNKTVKVMDLAYSEHAKEKYKPVIEIIK